MERRCKGSTENTHCVTFILSSSFSQWVTSVLVDMTHLFQGHRVRLLCSCGLLRSITSIYFCRHCLKLRCGNCVSHEVSVRLALGSTIMSGQGRETRGAHTLIPPPPRDNVTKQIRIIITWKVSRWTRLWWAGPVQHQHAGAGLLTCVNYLVGYHKLLSRFTYQ